MLRLTFVGRRRPETGHGFEDTEMPLLGLALVYHLKSNLVTNVLSRLRIWTSRHGLPVDWKANGGVCFRRENNRNPSWSFAEGNPFVVVIFEWKLLSPFPPP
jgi:hypothetical protein